VGHGIGCCAESVAGGAYAARPVRAAEARVQTDIRATLIYSVALGLSALGSFWFTAHVVNPLNEAGRAGNTIGALWAAISTVFVYRHTYEKSQSAAVSRIAGTAMSFALCLIYLALFPFHLWAIAVLISVGAFILALVGRPQDTMPASLATLVVLVIASIDPHNAWQQPILRFFDTVIGVAFGLAAVWLGLHVMRLLLGPPPVRGTGGAGASGGSAPTAP
jgi:hypothetical protein